MSTAKQVIVPINFDAIARQCGAVNAARAFTTSKGKLHEKVGVALQLACDNARQHNGASQEACEALGKEIRESEFFALLILDGIYGKTSVSNYAQGAQRALYFNLEWTPTLFQSVSKLPWSKKAKPKALASGTVKTTDRSELDKTLSKALAQARLLGLLEFSADLVDLLVERLDGFKEVEAK